MADIENTEVVETTEPTETEAGADTTPQEAPEAPTSDFMSDPAVLAYIDKRVHEGVKKALQGKAPKANTADPTEEEKRIFKRMTYRERLNLFLSNPQTYNKLTKGSN